MTTFILGGTNKKGLSVICFLILAALHGTSGQAHPPCVESDPGGKRVDPAIKKEFTTDAIVLQLGDARYSTGVVYSALAFRQWIPKTTKLVLWTKAKDIDICKTGYLSELFDVCEPQLYETIPPKLAKYPHCMDWAGGDFPNWLSKFALFRMTDFKQISYFDNDLAYLKPEGCSDLLKIDLGDTVMAAQCRNVDIHSSWFFDPENTNQRGAASVDWGPKHDLLDGGWVTVRPDIKIFNSIMQAMDEGDFKQTYHQGPICTAGAGPEQNFLATHVGLNNKTWMQLRPAYILSKREGNAADLASCAVHFVSGKPWNNIHGDDQEPYVGLTVQWRREARKLCHGVEKEYCDKIRGALNDIEREECGADNSGNGGGCGWVRKYHAEFQTWIQELEAEKKKKEEAGIADNVSATSEKASSTTAVDSVSKEEAAAPAEAEKQHLIEKVEKLAESMEEVKRDAKQANAHIATITGEVREIKTLTQSLAKDIQNINLASNESMEEVKRDAGEVREIKTLTQSLAKDIQNINLASNEPLLKQSMVLYAFPVAIATVVCFVRQRRAS